MQYSRIQILDDIVSRQIAAGEVIDRPAAILRELIDNSIDAGATRIEVLVKGAGLELIQVSDNGMGIKQEDLKISCLPHATSKIFTHDDLSNITSMGFRGEALPSIAAVSRLTITSRNPDEEHAWTIIANHTTISELQKATRTQGTTMKAEYLFQDIPARRNFLSSPQTELNYLKNMFLTKAAAFPDIVFSFQSETLSIKLPQESALARSIRICSNNVVAPDFIPLAYTELTHGGNTFGISASLGLPHIAQVNRKHIHLYINKRLIKEFSIVQAVEYAYRNILHGKKYPQVVIFLSIPPYLLDVNIHPAKSEVKIRAIDSVRKLVISSIEKAFVHISSEAKHFELKQRNLEEPILPNPLATKRADPSTDQSTDQKTDKSTDQSTNKHDSALDTPATPAPTNANGQSNEQSNEQSNAHANGHDTSPSVLPTQDYAHKSNKSQATHEHVFSSYHSSPQTLPQISPQKSPDAHINKKILDNLASHNDDITQTTEKVNEEEWEYKGCLFDTYLIFEHTDASNNMTQKMILLDFHATHERLIYDNLVENSKSHQILIPIPLQIDLDKSSVATLVEQYAKINIIIETDHAQHQLVAIPHMSPISADEIAKIIEQHYEDDEINAKIFASRACRKAAKAGDHVDKAGAYRLLQDGLSLETPRCPHGRPLWIEFKKYELDKMIGRVH